MIEQTLRGLLYLFVLSHIGEVKSWGTMRYTYLKSELHLAATFSFAGRTWRP